VNELYQIATDPTLPLEARYAAIKVMQHKRKVDPVNYVKREERATKQRKYNARRGDYRYYPTA
jgi:hypothetical protein